MRRIAAAGGVALWLVALTATGGALGADLALPSPWWSPDAWEAAHSASSAVVTLVRLGALAAVAHLLATTIIGIVAEMSGRRPWRAKAPPRFVRRLVSIAVCGALALPATAGAEEAPPMVTMQVLDDDIPDDDQPSSDVAVMVLVDGATPASETPTTWTVRPGDHLWSIAHDHLRDRWERIPTDAEITPYWQDLIAANRDRLVDPANPDLIHPGQVLRLPHPFGAPMPEDTRG